MDSVGQGSLFSGETDELHVLSVNELATYLRTLLEYNEILQNLWVQGEVSNCKTYPSGHCYFTLKESDAQLSCVFFKNARLRSGAPELRDGMALAVNGSISFYERDGKLQCYVDSVKSLGAGALFKRFEELKARLRSEGLFEEARKRPLPARPALLGIVTSPQAAAWRDMLRVLRMRNPLIRVLFSPTLVQGAEAPAAIAAAIDLLNEHGEADVLIVARGGGSIEELWAFNDEQVVRAIARSRIPVITGIGHETDFTIADFVADYRASTPTAAASVAVADIADLQVRVQEQHLLLASLMQGYLDQRHELLKQHVLELEHLSPIGIIERRRQQLDDLSERLHTHMEHLLTLRRERLRGLSLRLHALSPLVTIARGYAVVRKVEDQSVVSQVQQIQVGEKVQIQLQNGSIYAEICAE